MTQLNFLGWCNLSGSNRIRSDVLHEIEFFYETFEKRLVLLKGFKFTIFSSDSHVSPLMAGSMNGNKRR